MNHLLNLENKLTIFDEVVTLSGFWLKNTENRC